ncbi:hypothetical protein [Isorropodon fossajaponicum symbiont]|uniref:hypothetical protein n=1 Tax=Isorropodon fossajaponicum symbiont TaxID=883811 RepID=UPI001915273B|nr:hypothetical protein [Isorropodon fossajaponicum symbiont]
MAKSNQIMTTLFVWLVLVLLDLFVVREMDNWDIKRVVVNFGLSSLTMLSLLFILKPLITKSSASKNIVLVLIVLPVLVQMSHFEVYKNFTHPVLAFMLLQKILG